MNIPRRHQQEYPNTHTISLAPAQTVRNTLHATFCSLPKKFWVLSVVVLLAFFVPILVTANPHEPMHSPLNGLIEQKTNPATQASSNVTTNSQHKAAGTGSVHQRTDLSVNGQPIPVPEHGTHTEVLSTNNSETSVTTTSDSGQTVTGNNSSISSSIHVQVNVHQEHERR